MATDASRTLVLYASSGGSTKDVAEFVAARLRARGVAVDVHGVEEVPDAHGYDAVVLGSAVHDEALLPAVEHFVLSNCDALRVTPVWVFSLGVGPSLRGPVGHLLRDAVPPRIAELCELIGPRDYHAFAGVVPRANAPLIARLVLRLCGGRYGDLRDWPAIDAWTSHIAAYPHGAVAA
ncbi:flavodoxin domain-containing protein [Actinophytocola sp.]|uniref:flavodoxin domain-containing protein n=1 Tax=Actinophytocola sp. TaxID=1872138 RepID=UPI002D31E5BC|nr:flavodoxin domain-containing protein [Actinophytocola sp.]HYQ63394.1 flavodoxin domain-containing protein [Actinophytocola sp.]